VILPRCTLQWEDLLYPSWNSRRTMKSKRWDVGSLWKLKSEWNSVVRTGILACPWHFAINTPTFLAGETKAVQIGLNYVQVFMAFNQLPLRALLFGTVKLPPSLWYVRFHSQERSSCAARAWMAGPCWRHLVNSNRDRMISHPVGLHERQRVQREGEESWQWSPRSLSPS